MDRYTKVVLTVIAVCLVWISVNVVPTVNAAPGSGYAVAASGAGFVRLDVASGEAVVCAPGPSNSFVCTPLRNVQLQTGNR